MCVCGGGGSDLQFLLRKWIVKIMRLCTIKCNNKLELLGGLVRGVDQHLDGPFPHAHACIPRIASSCIDICPNKIGLKIEK